MTENILHTHIQKNIFWTSVAFIILCAGFYMYLINMTIHNVVAREGYESEATRVMLAIGTEEFNYIGMRNNITLARAYSLGFSDAGEKTFMTRNSKGFVSYVSKQ